jgi:2-oxoglutarate dehydrogenase E2 component (dihydrolipoamide succinyltransferase)
LCFNAGDPVKEDDIIAQIETDKVTIDVKFTSKGAGTVTAMLVSPGDVVQVGQMLAKVDTGMVTPTASEVMNKSEPTKSAEAAPQPKTATTPAPAKQVR